jgi:hypothetical protein
VKARNLYNNTVLFEQPPTAWRNVMRHVNGTRHMFNRWYDEDRLVRAVGEAEPETAEVWRLGWTMMYKDFRDFLEIYERFSNKPCREHAQYAAWCYAAQGEDEKALRTLFCRAGVSGGLPPAGL